MGEENEGAVTATGGGAGAPPTDVPVTRGPAVQVRITQSPARFAPVTETCAVDYRITGTATDATLEVRSRGGTLLFRRAGMPHATGANRLEWAGQKTEGGAGHVGPHDSPLQVKIVCAPAGESPAAQVRVEIDSIAITDGRTGANPERLMVAGRADPEVEVTAQVKLKRTSGAAVDAAVAVGVDWTYEAGRGNCPKVNGGKDDTDVHWSAAPGFADFSGGTAFARNFTDAHGQSRVKLVGTRMAGDKWKVVARCLADPTGRTGDVLKRAEGRTYEIWREFTASHFYQIEGGVNIDSIAAESAIQTAFTPGFTLFHRPATAIPVTDARFTGEFLQDILPPDESELPATTRVRLTSDGDDTRTVTIRGKVNATNAAGEITGAADASETLTLTGTTAVVGTKRYLKIASMTTTASRDRTIRVEGADRPSDDDFLDQFDPGQTSKSNVEIDLDVNEKAQAWYDRNWVAINAKMDALARATTRQKALYGARYLHPKHDGRTSTGVTHYWAAFPRAEIVNQRTSTFHPDANWLTYLGWQYNEMIFIFFGGSDAHATTVARHEVAHASEHTAFGTGGTGGAADHCGASSCLMKEQDGSGGLCTDRTHHSLHRLMGYTYD